MHNRKIVILNRPKMMSTFLIFTLVMDFSEHRPLQLERVEHVHPKNVSGMKVHCHHPDHHALGQRLLARLGSRSYPPDKDCTIIQARSRVHRMREPPALRQHIKHSQYLSPENHTPCRLAVGITKKLTEEPPLSTMRCFTRNQVNATGKH
jgi:hypothetical protein